MTDAPAITCDHAIQAEQAEKAGQRIESGVGASSHAGEAPSALTIPCPCCGQLWLNPPDMVVHVDLNTAVIHGQAIYFTPHEILLLNALHKARKAVVPYADLYFALYGAAGRRSNNPKAILRVHLSNIRTKLHFVGFDIEPFAGVGYKLVATA